MHERGFRRVQDIGSSINSKVGRDRRQPSGSKHDWNNYWQSQKDALLTRRLDIDHLRSSLWCSTQGTYLSAEFPTFRHVNIDSYALLCNPPPPIATPGLQLLLNVCISHASVPEYHRMNALPTFNGDSHECP